MSGKIYVVGLGPGGRSHMTIKALQALEESEVIVGYKTYIEFIEDLVKNKEVESSGMKKELDRCRLALEKALEGKRVSLISSGDAGVYGMAGIMLEVVKEAGADVEVEVIPGISAVNAAASVLGAPVMHDFAVISLSDLLTSWEVIEKRLECAAQGDFIIALYNPKSHGRTQQIVKAQEVMRKYKSAQTPVGIVRNAQREGQEIQITTLDKMLEYDIDMLSVVIIGNSTTYIHEGKIITPRGYRL
ncbi:precorrin-3B C(17)-methyltransferase [Petroclostridium sp. X23]|uniref:precorrin-3B C(17)-methyltransferase n=1 Tax=Petroclostridium sp. X23 TaxID=3045146 RepID=UPI0024AE3876|nr:precorrin-3B C(17)-methyltransferase [Petroclostridium sp. X23]WHH60583.1 precorrin-3B C(17)-methyltransferase [Petroclostridium sp. X23]